MTETSDQSPEPFAPITAAQARIHRLYRYAAFHPARLSQVIVDRVLFFSNPAAFNDPWDCRPWYDLTVLDTQHGVDRYVDWYIAITRRHGPQIPEAEVMRRAEIFRSNPALLRSKIEEASSAIEQGIQERYRICCLGGVPDSELMWAHYGMGHTGICLVFSTANELFSGALKVFYRASYPLYDLASRAEGEELAVLLTKSASWSYEREYRLIGQERNNAIGETILVANHLVPIPEKSLTAVIVGCLAPDATVEAIREMIRRSGQAIALKRAMRARDRYQLTVVDV